MKCIHTYTQRQRRANIPKLKNVSAGENLKNHLRNLTPLFYRRGICWLEKGKDKLKITQLFYYFLLSISWTLTFVYELSRTAVLCLGSGSLHCGQGNEPEQRAGVIRELTLCRFLSVDGCISLNDHNISHSHALLTMWLQHSFHQLWGLCSHPLTWSLWLQTVEYGRSEAMQLPSLGHKEIQLLLLSLSSLSLSLSLLSAWRPNHHVWRQAKLAHMQRPCG